MDTRKVDTRKAMALVGEQHGAARLPCRGCTADCRHFKICDGRPWRTLHELMEPGKTKSV